MSKFYINLSVVEPYVKYLYDYKVRTQQFINKTDSRFQNIRTIFDDSTVEGFLEITNSINSEMTQIISTIDNCADTMKKEAIAYRVYLGR